MTIPLRSLPQPWLNTLLGFEASPVVPTGSRGGQPLTSVPYSEAVTKLGTEFEEAIETHDICDISGTGGTCGV